MEVYQSERGFGRALALPCSLALPRSLALLGRAHALPQLSLSMLCSRLLKVPFSGCLAQSARESARAKGAVLRVLGEFMHSLP